MPEIRNVQDLWRYSERILSEVWPETARRDARMLVTRILNFNKAEFYSNLYHPVSEQEISWMDEVMQERLQGDPMQYILGGQEFWGRSFMVGPGVLIPRPETEHLVEHALSLGLPEGLVRIADLGTGCGSIAITLSFLLPYARIEAIEREEEALFWARLNLNAFSAKNPQLLQRVHLIPGDMTEVLQGTYNLLLSNPPYIPSAEIDHLAPDVRQEPRSALDGGADGLDYYRILARLAIKHLCPEGHLAVEVGAGQAEAVSRIFEDAGLGNLQVVPDLAGIPRVVSAQMTNDK